MSAPIIPLNKEVDTLTDMKSVAESSFQQCKDMIKDFLMYSSGMKFKWKPILSYAYKV